MSSGSAGACAAEVSTLEGVATLVSTAAPDDDSAAPGLTNPVLCVPGEVSGQQSPTATVAADAEAPLTLEEKDIIQKEAAEPDQHQTAKQNPAGASPKSKRNGREEQERKQILLAKGASAQIPDDPRITLLFDLNGVLFIDKKEKLIRNGIEMLLQIPQEHFRLGVYSSRKRVNIDPAIRAIEHRLNKDGQQKQPLFTPGVVMSRDQCCPASEKHLSSANAKPWDVVKPLSQSFPGDRLARVILIDDDSFKAIPGEERNMILIPSCKNIRGEDTVLEDLAGALKGLCGAEDVREHTGGISEMILRRWKEQQPQREAAGCISEGTSGSAHPRKPRGDGKASHHQQHNEHRHHPHRHHREQHDHQHHQDHHGQRGHQNHHHRRQHPHHEQQHPQTGHGLHYEAPEGHHRHRHHQAGHRHHPPPGLVHGGFYHPSMGEGRLEQHPHQQYVHPHMYHHEDYEEPPPGFYGPPRHHHEDYEEPPPGFYGPPPHHHPGDVHAYREAQQHRQQHMEHMYHLRQQQLRDWEQQQWRDARGAPRHHSRPHPGQWDHQQQQRHWDPEPHHNGRFRDPRDMMMHGGGRFEEQRQWQQREQHHYHRN